MNVLITGATGFVGQALMAHLARSGHRPVPLRRAPAPGTKEPTWAPDAGRIDLEPAGPLDAVVHLAGETIAQRWTAAAKVRIRSSRVAGTRLLSEGIARLPQPPRVLVCASAVGFYGDRGDTVLDEDSGVGTGFLPELCEAWEAAAAPARERGLRVVHLRLGIVLDRTRGALARMLPAFRLGLGGRLGDGRQYWPWIALDDLLAVVDRALADEALDGPVNAVAPQATTNAAFTAALARALGRPAFLAVPRFVVTVLFGEMGREALLASARVRPARLLARGFAFRFGQIDEAFECLVRISHHRNDESEIRARLRNPPSC